jgi:hypothetical protein
MRNVKWFLVPLLFGFSINNNVCYGQQTRYISHAMLKGRPKSDTLVDKLNSIKYILDSTRIFITAMNSAGKELWKTDPWKDNNLEAYRVKRPIIARFSFGEYPNYDEKQRRKAKVKPTEVIWISYNNTQFGIIDKSTRKFTWFGQD